MQADLFGQMADSEGGSEVVGQFVVPGCDEVVYYRRFLSKSRADDCFRALLSAVEWKQDEIKLYGKKHPVPRLTAWYGDPEASYTYSGIRNAPRRWSAELLGLLQEVDDAVGATFNSVLLNRYRSGSDSLSWHSDDEPELGSEPTIASVSLGSARAFALRTKDGHERVASIVLEHGSLLLMRGRSQELFQHSVPKERKPVGERINLTFRVVCATGAQGNPLQKNSGPADGAFSH